VPRRHTLSSGIDKSGVDGCRKWAPLAARSPSMENAGRPLVRLRVPLLAAALIVWGSRATHALPTSSVRSAPLALEVDGQLGWVDGQHSGGVDLGATARVRYHVLTVGLSLQGASVGFGSMASAGIVGGVAVPIGFLRLDALAELGLNAYAGVGSNFLRDDPGTGATLPFAGARAALLARLHQKANGASVWLGPAFHYAEDLRSTTSTYTYWDDSANWSTGESSDQWVTESARIGQARYSFLAVASVTLPL
jgi:hypothetical protein